MKKVSAKLKCFPEDFVVEEIGDKWDCHIGEEFSQRPSLDSLDRDNPRDFIFCEMVKRDIDHFQAIKEIANKLKVSIKDIGYGGTKDKRAITSQRISLYKPDMERLREFSCSNIFLKNFKWSKRKIKMGYLDGNHFRITLRDIDKRDAIKVLNQIKKMSWFPNYFGGQRFGSIRGNNFKIGKLILKRDFEGAVWEILTGSSQEERGDVQYLREKLRKEKDFEKALKYFPVHLKLERDILYYLTRNKEDYFGAMKRSERKNILMFVNAVQSKVFNDILERALEEGIDFTKKGQQNCILPGYKTKFYKGRLGEIEKEVLDVHGLNLQDFDLKEISYLRIKGSFRRAVVEVNESKVELEDDDKFEGSKKIILEFKLPSGVYATTFLENFFIFD